MRVNFSSGEEELVNVWNDDEDIRPINSCRVRKCSSHILSPLQ